MAVKVVDSSAVAALLFGEPDGPVIAERIAGASLVAPGLLGFELANVCLIKQRRHVEQSTALAHALTLRSLLGIEEMSVDHDAVVELAATAGLTAYDASYLWLSQQLSAELVTLDRQLERAAEALSNPHRGA